MKPQQESRQIVSVDAGEVPVSPNNCRRKSRSHRRQRPVAAGHVPAEADPQA